MKRGGIRTWSLTQAARILEQPQHRLIYLCEQRVVRPDGRDARGRGSSRSFSARDLLEFAVVLRVRDLQVPASTLGALVYLLQAFESSVKEEDPEFELPWSLRQNDPADVRIVIGDGRCLYVSFARQCDEGPKIYGGIDLQTLRGGEHTEERERPPDPLRVFSPGSPDRSEFGGPERSQYCRVEICVTRVAQHLQLDR